MINMEKLIAIAQILTTPGNSQWMGTLQMK